MNKEGFTLIELIVSILILAVILTIGVPGVSQISKTIRENQYKNVIKNIEIAAAKYAFDTGKTSCLVDDLIKNGYLQTDDNLVVKNPMNNESLNCCLVEMSKINDYYKGVFQNCKYEEDGDCDLSVTNEPSIVFKKSGTEEEIKSDKWYNLSLVDVDINEAGFLCDYSCVWSSKTGVYQTGQNSGLTVIGTGTYTFSYIDSNDQLIQESITLKIDKDAPVIDKNETKIVPDEAGKNTITIIASDGNGSGIEFYSIDGKTYQESNVFSNLDAVPYKMCVKDKVGNETCVE